MMISNLFFPMVAVVSLANLVMGKKADLEPARIYGLTSRVTVGDAFELKCSMFGLKKADEPVHLYLCKDGVGTLVKTTAEDYTFTVKQASFESAGNYSCVFSRMKYNPPDVRRQGYTSVLVTVIDFLHPAVITVKESRVRQGEDVEFKCTSEDTPDKALFHAYLCRNQQIIDVNIWNSLKKETIFLLRQVQEDDSANYSCVLSEKLLAAKGLEFCKNNTVFLEVDDSAYPTVITIKPEPIPQCGENFFRILCSVAVLIVLVVVLTSGSFCQRKKEICEGQGDKLPIVSIVMEPQPVMVED